MSHFPHLIRLQRFSVGATLVFFWVLIAFLAVVVWQDLANGQILIHLAGQIGVAALVLAIAAAALRRWRVALALGVVGAAGALLVLPWLTAPGRTAAPVLRVMTANLQGVAADTAALAALIEREQIDVLALQEAPLWVPERLVPLTAVLPHAVAARDLLPASQARNLLLSRQPLRDLVVDRHGPSDHPVTVLAGVFTTALGDVSVHVLHLRWPLPPFGTIQGVQADVLAAWPMRGAATQVWLGDWNLTPWSLRLRRIVAGLGVDPPSVVAPTWRGVSGVGWLGGLPIDHVLTCGGLTVGALRLGPDIGSDHRPLIADLVAVPGRRCERRP
jgi:endonuclease/exonuclease/phosphatase (EEP) superfamily protein YafD